MPTTANTVVARYDAFKQLVKETIDVVYVTDEPRRPDKPAVEAFFQDGLSGEALAVQQASVKASILRNSAAVPPVYAVVPFTGATRSSPAGTAIKVSPTVTHGTYLTEAGLAERYDKCISGVLTIGAHSGARAAEVKEAGVKVTISPVAPDEGGTLTHLVVDVGGVGSEDTFLVEEAVERLGLRWVDLAGEAAQPGGFRPKEAYNLIISDPAVGDLPLFTVRICGDDGVIRSSLEATGSIPTAAGANVTAVQLARYLAMAAGEPGRVSDLRTCLAVLAQSYQPDAPDETPRDAAAAHGRDVVAAWIAVIAGLDVGTLRAAQAHVFGGGARVGDGTVPPNEVGAYMAAVLADVRAAPQSPPRPTGSPIADRVGQERYNATMPGEQRGTRRGLFGGGGAAGATTTPGAHAGLLAVLVPVCEPAATARTIFERMGHGLVEVFRAEAGLRGPLPAGLDQGLTDPVLEAAERDFGRIHAEALQAGFIQTEEHPADWDESMRVLQRIFLNRSATSTADGGEAVGGAGAGPTGVYGKFHPPPGSVVGLARAADSTLAGAVAATTIMPLAEPAAILAEHARYTANRDKAAPARALAATMLKAGVDNPVYGGAIRGLVVSNKRYTGDLPGKGEVALAPLQYRADMFAHAVGLVEKEMGHELVAKHRVGIDAVVAAIFSMTVKFADVVQYLGATAPEDEDLGHEGMLGTTTGPRAAADCERAMGRLAIVWRLFFVRALGCEEPEDGFGLVPLAQLAGSLDEKARAELFQHLFDRLGRGVEAMRRNPHAALVDLVAGVLATKAHKLSSLRARRDAADAGREAAKEQMGGGKANAPSTPAAQTGSKRQNEVGPNHQRNVEKRQRQKADRARVKAPAPAPLRLHGGGGVAAATPAPQSAAPSSSAARSSLTFTYAPNSLTTAIGRTQPIGCIEAFDALDFGGQPKPCAWASLMRGGCSSSKCRICTAPGGSPPAPPWAVKRVKDACSDALRQRMV